MFYQEAQPYLFQVSDSQGLQHPENLCCNPNMLDHWLPSDFWPPSPEHRTAVLVLESNLCPPAWAISSGETLYLLSMWSVLSTLLTAHNRWSEKDFEDHLISLRELNLKDSWPYLP